MFRQARFYLLQYSNFGTSRFAWKWWSSFSFRNKNIFGYKEQNNSWMINAVEIWGKSFLSPLKNHMANCSLHTAFPIMLTQYNIYLPIHMDVLWYQEFKKNFWFCNMYSHLFSGLVSTIFGCFQVHNCLGLACI